MDAVSLDLVKGVQFLLPEEDSLEPCYDVETIVNNICEEKPFFRIQPQTFKSDPREEE